MLKKSILAHMTWVSIAFSGQNLIDQSLNMWSSLAKEDLKAIHQFLEDYHPAFVDKEQTHAELKQWFNDGYSQALKLAGQSSSFEGYRDSLAFYIAGFRDGHLRIDTTQDQPLLWPQFLLTYRDGKFLITSEFPEKLLKDGPPQGAEVVAVNHQPPSVLMKSNLFPYVNDDPSIESSWTRVAPFLLIDQGSPWAEKIKTMTYRLNQIEFEYRLHWAEIQRDKIAQYAQLAAYGPPPNFSIHEFGDESIWISIPTFNSHREGAKEALQEIINRLPTLRNKKRVVFDLRGNTGGESTWVVKIVIAFYGKEYLSSLPHIKNEDALADDRLTLEMIRRLEKEVTEERDVLQVSDFQKLLNHYQQVKAAYEKGDTLFRRSTDVHAFSEIKQAGLNVSSPVTGQVYLLTDGRCFSSGLIFADSILSIPGVIHIGTSTNADTQFSQPFLIQLPSGKSRLSVPTMIRRNWERGNNEPYYPGHVFHGYMGDQKQLEYWVLNLN